MADSPDLTRTRCSVHVQREAAARCPECRHFFCRECVTEHGDRAICADCLGRLARTGIHGGRRSFHLFVRAAQILLGILTAWFFFYMVGAFLSSLPDNFHETSRGTGVPGPP